MTLGLLGMPGQGEVLVILIVILLLFGGKKLPELARALGRSLSEFKRGREDGENPKLKGHGEGGADLPGGSESPSDKT